MEKIPIHIALVGHIDHGKTKLSETLTELVSTAGLDKHPQSKEKGITIDIGFSFFTLKEYSITLVDAPGHADLIRSVVAASSIADGAILVIDGKEGPKIQTGEHVLILESFNINNVIIALNKIDLLESDEIEKVKKRIENLIKDTRLKDAPIIPVSAKTGKGIEELKKTLHLIIKNPQRMVEGPFKMPIDHHFAIKGMGTVLTGTVHRGEASIGDEVEIVPLKLKYKIKSIQIMKESKKKVTAGNRVGIAISGLDPKKIDRGYYLSAPDSITSTEYISIECKVNRLYQKTLKPQMTTHLTVGMITVAGTVYPFKMDGNKRILLEEVKKNEDFLAFIQLHNIIAVEKGDPVLLSRLDLPPTSLRIVASGKVMDTHILPIQQMHRTSTKIGKIKDLHHREGVVIQGLTQSKIGADKLRKRKVLTSKNLEGTIINSFGTKGLVIAHFPTLPDENEEIYFTKLKRYKL